MLLGEVARSRLPAWRILAGLELRLTDDEPLQPDVCGWRAERMPSLPSQPYVTSVPDWIGEVPCRPFYKREKLAVYAASGVPHVWWIDPVEQTLEVYRLGDDHRWLDVRLFQADARVRLEPFAAIELDLAALWG